MDRTNARHPHPKIKKPMQSHASAHKPSKAVIALFSLGCGCVVVLLMLSLFAILMMQLDLPQEVLRIPALLSVCLGTFASAATASRFVANRRLVCGVLYGFVYYILIEVVTFLFQGTLLIDTVTIVNAGVLLLSGAAGGVLSAMNPSNRQVLRG